MRNWVKIHEDDLQEPQMRSAISKNPMVLPVWIGILVKCCEARNPKIQYLGTEDILSIAESIKVPTKDVHAAIDDLVVFGKLKNEGGYLHVVPWLEKCSEYLARKHRGDFPSRKASTTPPTTQETIVEPPKPAPTPIPEPIVTPPPATTLPPLDPKPVIEKQPELSVEPRKPANLGVMGEAKGRIWALFGRKPSCIASYMEDQLVLEVISRPDFQKELLDVEQYQKKSPQFFPRSVNKLLSIWTEILDRARSNGNGNGNGYHNPTTTRPDIRIRVIDDLISKSPANPESVHYDQDCTQETRNEYKRLRLEREKAQREIVGI